MLLQCLFFRQTGSQRLRLRAHTFATVHGNHFECPGRASAATGLQLVRCHVDAAMHRYMQYCRVQGVPPLHQQHQCLETCVAVHM